MFKHFRGWRGYFLAGVLIAAVFLGDALLVRGEPVLFCPEDAHWLARSPNFPRVYKSILQSGGGRALLDEAPEYYAAWQLRARFDTGVRPTPLRWRVWLGRDFLAATTDDGWGVCVRPGLALRVADSLRGLRGWRPAVRRFGAYYYAWRDGALIFSRSENYVLASLKSEPIPGRTREDVLTVYETRAMRSVFFISDQDGQLRLEGVLDGAFATRTSQPLTIAGLPRDAIASVAAQLPQDLKVLSRSVSELASRHADLSSPGLRKLREMGHELMSAWTPVDELENGWDRDLSELAFVLFDVDTADYLPIPELGVVLRARHGANGAHPLAPLAAEGPAQPYEWAGRPGLIVPRAGEKAAVCLSNQGADWLAASQEPAMARLLSALGALTEDEWNSVSAKANGAVAVCVDLAKVSERAQALLRKWARLELIPAMNTDDVEKEVMPLLRVVARIGTARIDFGNSWDGRLGFEAVLSESAGS